MNNDIERKQAVLFHYPFLDDETVEACLYYIYKETSKTSRRLSPGLVFDAFTAVSAMGISKRYPTLPSWEIKEICHKLIDLSKSLQINCFQDNDKIRRVYEEVVRLPSSSDEINTILVELVGESNVEVIQTRLLQIAVYIRTAKKNLHSTSTTEGDNIIADIEANLVNFLNSVSKQVFREIYPLLRELVAITPKVGVFGVKIDELRDNAAAYHEGRSRECCFYAVAENIREAVHRRLSGDVIQTIDELVSFLQSETSYAFISGRYCRASQEEKLAELNSEQFKNLLTVREQLKLIWNDPFHVNLDTIGKRRSLLTETQGFVNHTVSLCTMLFSPLKKKIEGNDQSGFSSMMKNAINALSKGRHEEMHLGPVRYALNSTIFSLAGTIEKGKGSVLLDLMTLDCVLENVSIVYYSNIVNLKLASIDDSNYEYAIETLTDLVFCAKSTGQGTQAMLKLATSLIDNLESDQETKKVEAQAYIGEIDKELLRFIYKLSRDITSLLVNSSYHRTSDDLERLQTQLLNDMTREKTTHLCANLLSSIGGFLGGTGNEQIRKLSKIDISAEDRPREKIVNLRDMVFYFGSGVKDLPSTGGRDWFLGGKGASEVAMSRIVTKDNSLEVDVPHGFGLGTQTWRLIKGKEEKQNELRNIISKEVEVLEKRTGKKLGEPSNPLLLVARSGAIVSLPGVLPTITHIGLNDEIVAAWAKTLKQPYRAYHAYIRFLFNYIGTIFRGSRITRQTLFEGIGAKRVFQLFVENVDDLKRTIVQVKKNIGSATNGFEIPENVHDQLFKSVLAVFESYELEEVVSHHQELKSIPAEYQTACLIQDCLPVLDDDDCSGVLLTRNPLDGGEGQIEFIRDFGEDLAGGRVRPGSSEKFERAYPLQNEKLRNTGNILEKEYASPMDIEFSVRDGHTYILQTRPLKLAPMADVVNAYNFYTRGLMSDDELIARTRRIVGQPLMNTFLEEIQKQNHAPIASGQPIAGGVVSGRIIHNVDRISDYPDERIIFITKSNVPKEVTTKPWIDGYISEEGGVTSHASLLSIGRLPCIVGVRWNHFEESIVLGDGVEIQEGEIVTLDANDGCIYKGSLPILSSPENNPDYLKAEQAILDLVKKREEYILTSKPPEQI